MRIEKSGFSFLAVVLGIVFFQACTALPPSQKPETPAPGHTAQMSPVEKAFPTAAGEELSLPAFERLPGEARAYLRELAVASLRGDTAFLISQGEKNYEARVRPLFDEPSYLALLYRTGSYAQEKPSDASTLPRLDGRKIRSLKFTGWDEKGPLIDARGLFTLDSGEELVCRVSVLWKLPEPRIIGREP